MGAAALSVDKPGRASLSGELDFASVPAIWPQLAALIAGQSSLQVSLAGVDAANSAALALLIEAAEQAREHAVQLQFCDLPQGLVDLAELCDALPLIPGATPA